MAAAPGGWPAPWPNVVELADVTSATDTVDVLVADHAAPRVEEKLRGRSMVRVEGGTQALRRTVHARLTIHPGQVTTISVPDPFGALILKAAAYQTDTRERERHLHDAEKALPDDHPAWRRIPSAARKDGQAALRLLCTPLDLSGSYAFTL